MKHRWIGQLGMRLVTMPIVPGPHSSCELPETIEELKQILKLQLKNAR